MTLRKYNYNPMFRFPLVLVSALFADSANSRLLAASGGRVTGAAAAGSQQLLSPRRRGHDDQRSGFVRSCIARCCGGRRHRQEDGDPPGRDGSQEGAPEGGAPPAPQGEGLSQPLPYAAHQGSANAAAASSVRLGGLAVGEVYSHSHVGAPRPAAVGSQLRQRRGPPQRPDTAAPPRAASSSRGGRKLDESGRHFDEQMGRRFDEMARQHAEICRQDTEFCRHDAALCRLWREEMVRKLEAAGRQHPDIRPQLLRGSVKKRSSFCQGFFEDMVRQLEPARRQDPEVLARLLKAVEAAVEAWLENGRRIEQRKLSASTEGQDGGPPGGRSQEIAPEGDALALQGASKPVHDTTAQQNANDMSQRSDMPAPGAAAASSSRLGGLVGREVGGPVHVDAPPADVRSQLRQRRGPPQRPLHTHADAPPATVANSRDEALIMRRRVQKCFPRPEAPRAGHGRPGDGQTQQEAGRPGAYEDRGDPWEPIHRIPEENRWRTRVNGSDTAARARASFVEGFGNDLEVGAEDGSGTGGTFQEGQWWSGSPSEAPSCEK
ncbi:unnamed protein product [Amoebophrya sp. A120]|nr:unnamed protein product [Amoebophrya sp. A120]|eukprot:GSA120T00000362001.1